METEIANQIRRSNDEEKNKVDTYDGGLIIATVRAKAMWKSLMEDDAHPDEIEIAAANYRKLAEETSEIVSEKAGRESNNAATKRARARRKKYSKLLSKNYLSSKLASKRKQSKSKRTQQRQKVGGLELGYIYENGGDEIRESDHNNRDGDNADDRSSNAFVSVLMFQFFLVNFLSFFL